MKAVTKNCPCNSKCDTAAQNHYVKGWGNLVRLWKAQKLCDVVVNVKGKTFRCHSVVPAAASPFFRRAFTKKQELSCEGALFNKEIIIDFMSPELFEQVRRGCGFQIMKKGFVT